MPTTLPAIRTRPRIAAVARRPTADSPCAPVVTGVTVTKVSTGRFSAWRGIGSIAPGGGGLRERSSGAEIARDIRGREHRNKQWYNSFGGYSIVTAAMLFHDVR